MNPCVGACEVAGSEQSPPPDDGRSTEVLEGGNEDGKKMSRRHGLRENN